MNILAKPIFKIKSKFLLVKYLWYLQNNNKATCINNPKYFYSLNILPMGIYVSETDDSYTKIFYSLLWCIIKKTQNQSEYPKYTESGYKLYHLWWNII